MKKIQLHLYFTKQTQLATLAFKSLRFNIHFKLWESCPDKVQGCPWCLIPVKNSELRGK